MRLLCSTSTRGASVRDMPAAAFQATFTDWRLVKGRKVVQVVLEIPIEQADQAYQVLGGMPDPGSSVWCAVARLKQESEVMPTATTAIPRTTETAPASTSEPSARAPKAFREMSYAQQAGILCSDKKFWRFLSEEYCDVNEAIQTEDEAVLVIRGICLVDSRRDIVPGSVAARAWRELVDHYRVWELVPV